MTANGYIKYDLTVGVVDANILASLVMAPFMALALWFFHLTVPKSEAMFTAWDGAVMLLMIITLIVIHELIHGLTWGCFAKKHLKSIDLRITRRWGSMKNVNHKRNPLNKSPICLGIGISLGFIWGAVLKNIPIGLLIGVCVGSYYAVIAKRKISTHHAFD